MSYHIYNTIWKLWHPYCNTTPCPTPTMFLAVFFRVAQILHTTATNHNYFHAAHTCIHQQQGTSSSTLKSVFFYSSLVAHFCRCQVRVSACVCVWECPSSAQSEYKFNVAHNFHQHVPHYGCSFLPRLLSDILTLLGSFNALDYGPRIDRAWRLERRFKCPTREHFCNHHQQRAAAESSTASSIDSDDYYGPHEATKTELHEPEPNKQTKKKTL